MRKILLLIFVLALILGLCRCCTATYNQKATTWALPLAKLTSTPPSDTATQMWVCFSGGGTRAMAMGYYVVDAFQRIKYSDSTTLRDEIDYASGVSGGSFVAAALGVYGAKEWVDFYKTGVYRNIQKDLVLRLFNPVNWLWLLSPYYTRTDLAAEFYSQYIFKDRVFGQLATRPRVYINTTLLAEGAHIVFTPDYFSYIKSDLSLYPVGFACAASSAFPGGFAPLTLRNYNDSVYTPEALMKDKKYRAAKLNADNNVSAYDFCRMYEFLHDRDNQWLHVSDGGIAGNSGVERVLDEFNTGGAVLRAINNTQVPLHRLIFVVVNAGTAKPDKSCTKRDIPDIPKVLLYTTGIAIDVVSGQRMTQLQDQVNATWQMIQGSDNPAWKQMEKPYVIELNTRNIKTPALAEKFNALPTSFDLPTESLYIIQQVVQELLDNNAEYQRLLTSLKHADN